MITQRLTDGIASLYKSKSWRLYFEGLEGKGEVVDESTFNQPTIVLSSNPLKNHSVAGLVSYMLCVKSYNSESSLEHRDGELS